MEFMESISLRSVALDFPVVRYIPLGTERGQVRELVRRHGKIEYLPELDSPHRQRRPDVRGCQGVPQGMGAVVRPDTPVVVGFALDVFAVFVVQEGDYLFQHWLGHGKARAKDRARKLERLVGADALGRNEVFEARSCSHTRGVVKLDALIDALVDDIMQCGFETGLGQGLAIL